MPRPLAIATHRLLAVALAAALLVVASLPATAQEAGQDDTAPIPTATAALGDSITRAFHSNCGLLNDCPANSWSTGSAVDSHRVRLETLAGTSIRGDNLAVTGADSGDLVGQAQGVAADIGYVTILMGANDACTDTVGQMTPVADFQARVAAALDTIHTRAPDAAVYIATIPDLLRLWEVGSTSGSARFTWWLYGICQSMLASPLSTQAADVQRRATVRQRVVDYNTALTAECVAYAGTCRTDGGAVFGYPFELGHLSTIDYFHPNVTGQEILAAETWAAGYTWTTGEPPANQDPVANAGPDQVVTADASRTATVVLDGSGSSDPDGDSLTFAWSWDGGSATGGGPKVVLDEGTTTVTLSVADGRGGTATDTVAITVEPYSEPPAQLVVHVADLDGSSASAPRNRWDATVTVTVHDIGEGAVAGVQVQGSWSDGANGGGSCVTDDNGECTITKTQVKGKESSVTFTVSGLSVADGTYDASLNHDPDGDSDGTTIVVSAP